MYNPLYALAGSGTLEQIDTIAPSPASLFFFFSLVYVYIYLVYIYVYMYTRLFLVFFFFLQGSISFPILPVRSRYRGDISVNGLNGSDL